MRRNKYFVDKLPDNGLYIHTRRDPALKLAVLQVCAMWGTYLFEDYAEFCEAVDKFELEYSPSPDSYDSRLIPIFIEYMNLQAERIESPIDVCFANHILPDLKGFALTSLFKNSGSNIFDIEPHLSSMLFKTDLDDTIMLADIQTPFPDQTIYINLDGCGGDAFAVLASGLHKEPLAPLAGAFVTHMETLPSRGAALYLHTVHLWDVGGGVQAPLINTYPLIPEFGEKREIRTINEWYTVLAEDVIGDDAYEAYKLVINILLYMQYQDRDVKLRWPDDIPLTIKKSLHQGKKKQQEKAEATLKKRGYSKIHFCGYQMQREYERLYAETGREVNPHWRRGHWRNQACGPGMKEHKLVWIKPMIVRRDKGEPEYGHIYQVGGTA